MLAGLTQADLARATGCHPRSIRYWENKGSNPPTNVASTLDSIEQALNRHGVIAFSTPTPGVRCSNCIKSDCNLPLRGKFRMLVLLIRERLASTGAQKNLV
jgi:transcriptional regulator with XRE-family HTH domain